MVNLAVLVREDGVVGRQQERVERFKGHARGVAIFTSGTRLRVLGKDSLKLVSTCIGLLKTISKLP